MPNKDKNKKPGKGGSKAAVPAKTGNPEHEDAPRNITEYREVGIGMPVSGKEMDEIKERAKKLDR